MIGFHDAQFEIIDGYYCNDGRDNTINSVINDLYNLRLNLTKGKHPAQMVFDLLVNSMCGTQAIIQPVDTDIVIKGNQGGFGARIS